MAPQLLSDEEWDRLSKLLARIGGEHAMNIEQLDGFLAALICGPDDVPQVEYLREVLGDDIDNDTAHAPQPSLQDLASLIARHHDVISHTLRSGNVFMPLLIEDERGLSPANDWANGFVHAMELNKDDWAELLGDERNGGSLVPILALANEHHPDPEMRPYDKPISSDMRERLIVGAAAGVMKIYRYFRTQQLMAETQVLTAETQRPMATLPISDSTTHRRIAPKVGRNEPCPCGSGKKFKQCCGKITLH